MTISGLLPDEAELMSLLFEILGWQVVAARPAQRQPARLRVSRAQGIVHVATSDPALARQLAAAGLDRLVPPFNLAALEQLSALAS